MKQYTAKRKLMIIDDDDSSRILIAEILADICPDIIQAKSGEEALPLFKKYSNELALVFLDIKLPDCSGLDLVAQFKSEDYCVPIIAVSATSPDELKKKCEISGFDSCLSKPFEINDLMKIVDCYLERRPMST